MNISKETAQKLYNAGKTAREILEWGASKAAVGLAIWFGGAAVIGGFGSHFQKGTDNSQNTYLEGMKYVSVENSDSCVVIDPRKEQIVTVQGYQNSRFTQVLRAAAPIISMTEGEEVVLGKAPVYASAPCSVIKDGITTYENGILARGAEYANSKVLLANLQKAREDFNRMEDLTFTVQPKAPSTDNSQAPQQPQQPQP
ncbi:MAG: hypothetical protein H6862_01935 [Rhodospirillales bacterium]|nr:hypothetical protein [Rhodospirillales bacterium]